MCAHLEDIDFTSDFLSHFQVFDFPLIEDLDGHFQSSDNMMRHYSTEQQQRNGEVTTGRGTTSNWELSTYV